MKVSMGLKAGLLRQVSLAAGFAAAAVLLAAPLSAAAVIRPWPVATGTTTVIAPADAAGTGGLDVLEPATRPVEVVATAKFETIEKSVSGWVATATKKPPKPSKGG